MNYRKGALVLATLLLATALLWGASGIRSSSGALPPLHTVVVDRGLVSQRVVAHGTLQPLQTVLVGSQVSGIVDAIHVDFNSRVRQGQLIARIESSTFAAEVRSAAAELEAAHARLELATLQWQRIQQMREQGIVTPAEVEEMRSDLRQADAQHSVRRHALERARRELQRSSIYSPTDGIVVSRNVDVGQTVAASLSAPVLFEIATDLSRMHIHAHVSEADIGHVREGQAVRFQVDAHREREFVGEVVQVRNAPVTVDNVVHYETIITVDNPEGLLKPGMTAEVSVITAEARDALRARNSALRARLPDEIRPADAAHADGANGRVFVLRNGMIVAVPVHTGLSDGVHTEIVSGVSAGDTLVVGLALRGNSTNDGRSFLRGDQAQF